METHRSYRAVGRQRSAHPQFHITHTQTRISVLQKTAAAENVVQRQHITATVLDIMRSVLTSEQAKHRSLHRFHVNLKPQNSATSPEINCLHL